MNIPTVLGAFCGVAVEFWVFSWHLNKFSHHFWWHKHPALSLLAASVSASIYGVPVVFGVPWLLQLAGRRIPPWRNRERRGR